MTVFKMHTWWIMPACCLPLSISRSPNASQNQHHYPHFTGALGLSKQKKVLVHHSGRWMLLGEYLCICPAVFSMHVHWSCPHCEGLTSRCPEVFDKSPVSFFFPCPGKLSSWKLMPQPGKAKHMEVSHFADRKHSGDQRSSTRLGLKPGLQPTFPDLWGSAKPTKPPSPSLRALYFLYSFHGFQEDLKPHGHGFRNVCSAGWLAGPLKPRALL